MAVSQPPPYPRAPIGEVTKDLLGKPVVTLTTQWGIYFRDQRQYLAQVPVSATPTAVIEPDANDAIGTTSIVTPTQDGLYSLEYYLAIITADGAASSAQVVMGWTDQGLTKTHTFTAVTGDTTTTTGSERYLVQADGAAPITYSVTYSSTTPNAMHYTLYLVLSNVAAVN